MPIDIGTSSPGARTGAGLDSLPLPWGSPESAELQSVIWKVESRMWKQFLATVRDEKIPGDLVEFGVSVGNSLEELIEYCEEINLDINIYGLDSFEGLPELSSRPALVAEGPVRRPL